MAHAQVLQTEAGVAIAVTLSGKDAANSPLSYTIVDGPLYGTISGAAPTLTYTRLAPTPAGWTASASPSAMVLRPAQAGRCQHSHPALVVGRQRPRVSKWTGPEAGEAGAGWPARTARARLSGGAGAV